MKIMKLRNAIDFLKVQHKPKMLDPVALQGYDMKRTFSIHIAL
jgi:hydroxyethylthiazole kinase-like sugar kinase family protein